MDGFGAGIPGHVGNARRSDDDLARAGGPLDPSDTKAHATGDDLPALLHLGMDVLWRAVPGPRPEVVHLQQPPVGVGCGLQEHDPLAADGVDQLVSRAHHQLDLGRRIPQPALTQCSRRDGPVNTLWPCVHSPRPPFG